MSTIRKTPTLVAVALLALLAACSSDSPTGPATTNLDGDEAQEWTGQALEMINEMVLDVPTIAAGDFLPAMAAKAEGDPVWDEVAQAWTFDAVIDFSEGEPPTSTGSLEMHVWVQFRNAEGPLPSALGATELEYRYAEGMTMQGSEDGASVAVDFAAGTTMLVAYVEGGYSLEATGSATVDATRSAEGRTERLDFGMGWGVDLSLPLGGCPSGSAWVEADPYRMGALYDGQGNVAWSLGAPGYSASGTDQLPCGYGY